MSKNTVKSYLKKMADGGFNTEELLKQRDPLLEKSFHAGNPAYKADKFEYLKSRLDYYEKELKRTGVTKLLLWQEYIESDPTGYRMSIRKLLDKKDSSHHFQFDIQTLI